MIGKGISILPPSGNQRGRGFKPKQRLLGQRLARFARMVGVIEPDRDDFGGHNRGQVRSPLKGVGFLSNEGEPNTSPRRRKSSPSTTLA